MDPKNKLQHFLQKNKTFFLNYKIKYKIVDYKHVGGITNWKSKVITIVNNDKKMFIGDVKNKKVESEYSAAGKAYQYLLSTLPNKKVYNKFIDDYKIIKLIDIENIGNYKQFKNIRDAYIVGFISRSNNFTEEKIEDIKSIMELIIYENTQKEGADVCLILYIGKNMERFIKNKNEIHIYSKDKNFIPLINIFKNKIKCKIIN